MTAVFPTIILTNQRASAVPVTVPTDVNVVRLVLDGGKTWLTPHRRDAGRLGITRLTDGG